MPLHAKRVRKESEVALVGMHVGEGYYAVDVPAVREIVSPVSFVPVPYAASIVRGVVDHRGHVVPIVDLRRRFGVPPIEPSRRTKWIIVEGGGQWMGLIVDDVTEVFSMSPADEREAPKLGPTDVTRGFSRVYVHDGTIVLVLDLAVLARAVEQGAGAVTPPSLRPPSATSGEGT